MKREMWTKKDCLLRMGWMTLRWEAGTTRSASSFAICQWLAWQEVELSLVVRFMYKGRTYMGSGGSDKLRLPGTS